MSAKKGWNLISKNYQSKTRISLEDVHYGPISAGESELKLLGNVSDKNVLEIGCGGGQNTIVLAKWGAKAVGLDISEEQIKYARRLAKKERVNVAFHVGNMENLGVFRDDTFDIVVSSFAVDYADNISKVFQEAFRVLRKRGLFVFAVVHPVAVKGRVIRRGKKKAWLMGSYFDRRRRLWTWRVPEGVAKFYGRPMIIEDYFNPLVASGFVVERILEPAPYPLQRMNENERKKIPYFADYFVKYYDVWRRVPYTIIFKARKSKDTSR